MAEAAGSAEEEDEEDDWELSSESSSGGWDETGVDEVTCVSRGVLCCFRVASRDVAPACRSLLEEEECWATPTCAAHEQCADAVAWLGGTLLLLCSHTQRLSVFDTARGCVVAQSAALPFEVYGIASDESGWLCACGAVRTATNENVALLRLEVPDEGPPRLVTCVAFGLDPPRGARAAHRPRDQMNGVRFGWALEEHSAAAPQGGSAEELPDSGAASSGLRRVRVLLAASQDKHVYTLALPHGSPAPSATGAAPQLRGHRQLSCLRFVTAVNCTAASPDGRWLVAVGDREECYVVGGARGWLSGDVARITLPLLDAASSLLRRPAGCQYACWSEDSRRLAVSSDSLNSVAVWAVSPDSSFKPLARLDAFRHEVLALTFLSGAHTLAFAEKESCIYAVDVDAAGEADAWRRPLSAVRGGVYLRERGVQRISLERMETPAAHVAATPRITGLACGPEGRLFLSQDRRLLSFRPLTAWSRAKHALFPIRFRTAVLLLVLANHVRQETNEPPGLAALPLDILLHIVSFAAVPQSVWLPPRPAAERRLQQDRDGEFWFDGSSEDSDEDT